MLKQKLALRSPVARTIIPQDDLIEKPHQMNDDRARVFERGRWHFSHPSAQLEAGHPPVSIISHPRSPRNSYFFPPIPQVILPGLLEFTLRLGYRRALRHAAGSVKRIADVYVAVRSARQSIEYHAEFVVRVHSLTLL